MRARNIKPGIFKNELLGAADPLLTLLFEGLWCLADREGRLEDRPLRIKAEVFPYRGELDVYGYLTKLEQLGFVRRYKFGEQPIIEVLNFKKHQSPHHTEKKSLLTTPVNSPLNNGGYPADLLIPDSLIADSPSGESPTPEAKPSVHVIDFNAAPGSANKPGARDGIRGTRIPADFVVTENHRRFAAENSLPEPDSRVGGFVDYWRGVPGNRGLKVDWDATFRNWLRRSSQDSIQKEKYADNGNRAERRQADNISAGEKAIAILQRRMAN